jgi:ABC-type amino acid transport substrate-binding protein
MSVVTGGMMCTGLVVYSLERVEEGLGHVRRYKSHFSEYVNKGKNLLPSWNSKQFKDLKDKRTGVPQTFSIKE